MNLTKEEYLLLCGQTYEKMALTMDSNSEDFYTYESTLDQLHTELGRAILEKSVSENEVAARYKKKFKPDLAK